MNFFLFHQIEPRSLVRSITEFSQVFGLSGLPSSWEAVGKKLDHMTGLSDTLGAMGTELAIVLKFSKETANAAAPFDIRSLIKRTQFGLILHPPDRRLTEQLKRRAASDPNSKIAEFEGVAIYSNFIPKLGHSNDLPAFADLDGWLILAASPDIVKNMIATKRGKILSLRTDAEFQRLSVGLVTEANGCFFASTQFGQELANIRDALTSGDRTSQSASPIALAISLDFFTRVISNLFDGYGISKQTDNGYRWEVHERKPNANGVDQILTSLFSILAGYAVANH